MAAGSVGKTNPRPSLKLATWRNEPRKASTANLAKRTEPTGLDLAKRTEATTSGLDVRSGRMNLEKFAKTNS
jgi:hypothetical protein